MLVSFVGSPALRESSGRLPPKRGTSRSLEHTFPSKLERNGAGSHLGTIARASRRSPSDRQGWEIQSCKVSFICIHSMKDSEQQAAPNSEESSGCIATIQGRRQAKFAGTHHRSF